MDGENESDGFATASEGEDKKVFVHNDLETNGKEEGEEESEEGDEEDRKRLEEEKLLAQLAVQQILSLEGGEDLNLSFELDEEEVGTPQQRPPQTKHKRKKNRKKRRKGNSKQ